MRNFFNLQMTALSRATVGFTRRRHVGKPYVEPPVQYSTTFDSLYANNFALSQSRSTVARPTITKPTTKSVGISTPSYTDPEYGTHIYLVTSTAETTSDTGSSLLRNDYSKRQMFNCDGTKYMAVTSTSWWYVYDFPSLTRNIVPGGVGGRVPLMAGMDCEPIWHPTDPHKIWYTRDRGGLIYYEVDITTGERTVLFDLTNIRPPGFEQAVRFSFGGEGRPSNDGRYWTFMAQREGYEGVGLCTYDRQTNTILSYVLTSTMPNWVGTSPRGTYAIIGWHNFSGGTYATANGRPTASADGTRAYPINGLAGTTWTQLDVSGEHGDVGIDAYGNEIWISAAYTPFDERMTEYDVYMTRIDNGQTTVFPELKATWGVNSGMHFSCTNFDRPGWSVITYDVGGTPSSWRHGKVVAVELATTNPKFYTLFDHQSDCSTYFASPLAAPNRDLTAIMFGSDFRNSGTPYLQYMCGLPSWAFPEAGASAPVKTVDPVISGSATPGGVVNRTLGSYVGLPVATVTGIWQQSADGSTGWTDIPGQTGSSYTVGVSNGVYISWFETAANGTLPNATTRSNVLMVAALAAPVNTVAPSYPLTGYTDSSITASVGTWTGNPTPSVSFVWQREITGTWTDSAITTRTSTLTPAGNWRAKEVATNSQGSTTAYGLTTVISLPAQEPVTSSSITFTGANGTTLEAFNAAWDGASTGYEIQSNKLLAVGGWSNNVAYFTQGGGSNQGAEIVMASPATFTAGGELLAVHIHADNGVGGYAAQVAGTQLRLLKNGTQEGVAVSHGVDLANTALSLRITSLGNRIRVYVQGSTTPLIDFTDAARITGGYVGYSNYSGGTPSRLQLNEFKYGSS